IFLYFHILISGLKKSVNVYVVSDHGMVGFNTPRKFIYLDKYINYNDVKMQLGSMILPIDEAAKKRIYESITKANITALKIYKKEDIPEKYHIKNGKLMLPLYLKVDYGYHFVMVRT